MSKYKIHIQTDWTLAYDSPDHLQPGGTKADNYTSPLFIDSIEETNETRPLRFMDLGCAGGLLVHDFLRRNHIAVGLEGSDYSVQHPRAEWPALYKRNLFTCDVSKTYQALIQEENEPEKPFICDAMSAWEVIEHIHPQRLGVFFENIRKHLKIGGKFYASVSTIAGYPHHQSVFSEDTWKNQIFPQLPGLALRDYPFDIRDAVRYEPTSFYICLERTR